MKLLIIVLLLLSVEAFAHRSFHHMNIHRTHRAFTMHHPRSFYSGYGTYYNYRAPIASSPAVPQGPTHDEKVKEANKEAREHNKEKEVAFDKKTADFEAAHPKQTQREERKDIDFSKYKDSAQLIVGNVHLYGVSEVKTFKDGKILVKAANGNFAFPKEVYDSAQKLNFDKVEK
jgi:hypothetical protein